ncbi:IclR family transcriptional regulator, partial [Mycobacterium sp. ITM-2017-0098]
MTLAVEKPAAITETPSAVIDRISLVLDAFDGPG